MAASVKFGEIETVVRRDLIKDDDPSKYRWSSFQVLAAIERSVCDVVSLNAWASYDQQTCRKIRRGFNRDVTRYCEADPKSLSETTTFVVNGSEMNAEQYLAYVRNLTVPIDERWHDAVAYFAAFHVLDTAGEDPELRRRASEFIKIAKENAVV